jgi:hypothetical protein
MWNIVMDRIARMWRRPRNRTRVYAVIAVAAVVASACSVRAMSDTGVLASITVTPTTTLGAAARRQMRATGLDVNGRIVNIAPTWAIVDGGGTISADGVFTASAVADVFQATVVASANGVSGRASITVMP